MKISKSKVAAVIVTAMAFGVFAGEEWVYDTSQRLPETKSVESGSLSAMSAFAFSAESSAAGIVDSVYCSCELSNAVEIRGDKPGMCIIVR